MTASKQLRSLFKREGIIRVAGAHNALGAKLVERAGFDCVWSSGLEISTSHAVPDANILTMSEYLAAAQSMADAITKPIIADCDTGYGNSNNVIHMIRKFEAAGISAVCIEDKIFPKVNSFIPGRQELAPVAEFVGKIMAAKNAQRTSEFMVIARVEALIAGWGIEEALKRADAYVQAGADAILIHSKQKTIEPIVEFIENLGFTIPIVVVPTTYYSVTVEKLEELGVKMVIYANHGIRAGIKAIESTLGEIIRTGSTESIEDKIAPMSLVFELQGMPQMKRDEETYLCGDLIKTRAIIPAAGDHMDEYSMKNIAADIPMAMLDINGKPLLQRQIEILRQAGINHITTIGGYRLEKIQVEGTRLVNNPLWKTTGELQSIIYGDEEYEGRTLVAYSDILFDTDTLKILLKSEDDITLLVDKTFDSKNYAADRKIDLVLVDDPPLKTRRSLSRKVRKKVLKIGNGIAPEKANCEYAGLALFSQKGFDIIRGYFKKYCIVSEMNNSDSQKLKCNISLVDILQELIDLEYNVYCVEVSSGWMEIHSFDDYKLACKLTAQ